jgi:hypothetical protein
MTASLFGTHFAIARGANATKGESEMGTHTGVRLEKKQAT